MKLAIESTTMIIHLNQPNDKKHNPKNKSTMTLLNYHFLQENGFKLLIPIISENEQNLTEAVTVWGKEIDGQIIRLELHKKSDKTAIDLLPDTEINDAPFQPDGLQLYIGEKAEMDQPYVTTVHYIEELEPYLKATV